MNSPTLICNGQRLVLGDKVGRGGEGEVYVVNDGTGRAVKIYHQPDADREAKVQALVKERYGDACPAVAFPLEVLRYSDGRFAGFTMSYIAGRQAIHELMSPRSRRKLYPDVDWRFLVRTALNVARNVASVHAAGVVIGDINSSGFLVSRKAMVTLIDADSFQVGSFRCQVGMPEYTPPELQNVSLHGIDRNAKHDAFGLAVILFQLLAVGRHPHAGVPRGRDIGLDEAIAINRFAFSVLRNVGASPPPATVRLDDLPRGIALLFERAFAPGSSDRPTAAEWIVELTHFEAGMAPCSRNPHHVVGTFGKLCPWCRIERETGRPAFMSSTAQPPINAQPDTDLHQTVRLAVGNAKLHASERIEPLFYRSTARPGTQARRLHFDRHRYFSGKNGMQLASAPGPAEPFVERFALADRNATSEVEAWRKRLSIPEIYKTMDKLSQALARLDSNKQRKADLVEHGVMRIVTGRALEKLREDRIDDVAIVGLGSALRNRLSDQGITTAADISREGLAAVRTLGATRTLALLLWHEKLAVAAERFLIQQTTFMARARAHVIGLFEQKILQSELAIRSDVAELDRLVRLASAGAQRMDAKLVAALAERDQGRVDLEHLGIEPTQALKAMALKASPVAPTSRTIAKRKLPKNLCPKCKGPLVKRWGTSGQAGAKTFLGCSRYPACNGNRPVIKGGNSP